MSEVLPVLPYLAALTVIAALVLSSGLRVAGHTVWLHALLVVALLVTAVHVMGKPKPFWTEITPTDEIEVVSAQYHPGVGIYIWVRSSPPVQYALPWDVGLARRMQEAERESGGMIMRRREGDRRGAHADRSGEDPDGPPENNGLDGQTEGGEWGVSPLPLPPGPAKEAE